ncbi:AABR07029862.1 [Phodopus roborovskii]|uniref:AABR07029862.1 protein n=1 Tax=Phodopus roborovskii TaxID=109678 RepID=A0AAU9Z4C4_PHORO|nr:AABR07029862.1 [Phodopus roborovskii]
MRHAGQRSRLPYRAFGRSKNNEAASRPRALGSAHPVAQGNKRRHFPAGPGRAQGAARTPSRARSAGGRARWPGSPPPAGAAAPGPPRVLEAAARGCAL